MSIITTDRRSSPSQFSGSEFFDVFLWKYSYTSTFKLYITNEISYMSNVFFSEISTETSCTMHPVHILHLILIWSSQQGLTVSESEISSWIKYFYRVSFGNRTYNHNQNISPLTHLITPAYLQFSQYTEDRHKTKNIPKPQIPSLKNGERQVFFQLRTVSKSLV